MNKKISEERASEDLGIPVCGLEESVQTLTVLYRGCNGESCPRCDGKDFGKLGNYTYNGKRYPRVLCRICGYVFSIVDLEKDGSTKQRAARIFNLNAKKADDLIDDALQFGLIKRNENGTYSKSVSAATKSEIYHRVPLYHDLIESVGYNLKRSVFENSLKNLDESLSSESKIKRDTLWRRYQEIATDIFVCEKTCKFSRTCKKDPRERIECDIVKKARVKRPVWRVDIEL